MRLGLLHRRLQLRVKLAIRNDALLPPDPREYKYKYSFFNCRESGMARLDLASWASVDLHFLSEDYNYNVQIADMTYDWNGIGMIGGTINFCEAWNSGLRLCEIWRRLSLGSWRRLGLKFRLGLGHWIWRRLDLTQPWPLHLAQPSPQSLAQARPWDHLYSAQAQRRRPRILA